MLIRVPETWPLPVVATVAMLLLAGLDLAGTIAAKEAVERRSWGWATAGALLFLALFWVYANSLQWADLGPVTLGWIVLLQVGVVLIDRFHYGTPLPAGAWVAIVVVMAAQGYLVLAARPAPPDAAPEVAVAEATAPTGAPRAIPGPRHADAGTTSVADASAPSASGVERAR